MNEILNLLQLEPQSPWRGWVSFAIGFLLFAALLLATLRIVFRQFERMARRSKNTFDDLLVENLRAPTRAFMVLLALYVSVELSVLPLKDMRLVVGGIKTTFILILIWSLARALDSAIRSDLLLAQSSASTKGMISIITRSVVFLVGLLMILDAVGISITPLLGSLGIGSLAVALALQDTLSNFFSSLYILADKPFQIGDFIELEGGTQGKVIKVGWRSTRIKTIGNNIIVIPNIKAASAILTNFDMQEHDAAISVPFGVAYNSDLNKVERVCVEVGKEIMKNLAEGVKAHEPVVQFREFADSSINGVVILRARAYSDRLTVQHHFIKDLHERFNKEGIEIPFPQRVIHSKGI